MGIERMKKARETIKQLEDLKISRKPGLLQLESVYVHPDFRGKGILGQLFEAHYAKFPEANRAQLITSIFENERAIKAYKKIGFEIMYEAVMSKEKHDSFDLELPFKGNISMEKQL